MTVKQRVTYWQACRQSQSISPASKALIKGVMHSLSERGKFIFFNIVLYSLYTPPE